MKPSQTIFNKDFDTVTIPTKEYERLLGYKQLCQEFKAILGGDSEWVTNYLMNGTMRVWNTLHAHTIMNVMDANTTVVMTYEFKNCQRPSRQRNSISQRQKKNIPSYFTRLVKIPYLCWRLSNRQKKPS